MQEDRYTLSRDRLMKLLYKRGVIYTLGVCMGILARLSQYDYNLYKEIEHRANK